MADSTYRFLLSTSMVGQPPNRKGAIESLKGDKSFRICNPNNCLIILAFALDKPWYYAQLVDSTLLHHIDPFLAAFLVFCCIVTSVFRIMCCLRSFISGSVCMTRNIKGICSWLTIINWFCPSSLYSLLLRHKYHCVVLSLSFSMSSCMMILHFRSRVYAWQGTWKHDFKYFSHECIYIKICKFKCIYSWTFG